ncbi:hypothetical protein RBB78_01125 [Tunturiibacter empetritectus]|uniref:hypothetical protein n=1 Tax=Tunturiibacter empetritectus TaxID=3069691 RepID=UPI003D9B09D2
MRPSETSRFNALLCALALIGCALAARPFVETGISDDWSYVRTAQLLAQTGHVVYNGWAAMLLGWQLPVAALSFKLFGFSFTAARMSMLVIAAATTFMIQRSFVQAGLAEWNATLATLTLVLSPLFLPLSLMFMTDVSGLFAIGVCFYGCLRALKASSSHKSAAWISFAALFNAVGGTARQIAWLGVLVMVPSAMWLLRRQKNVVIVGMAALTVSIAIIFGSLHWFLLQPHTLSESPWIKLFSLAVCRVLLYQLLRIIVGVSFLMLPVLFGYLLALRRSRRQLPAVLAIVILGMCLARMLQLHSFQGIVPWPIPPIFAGGIVSSAGIWEASPIFGTRPEWLSWHIRLIVTAITLVSLISTILVVCFGVRKHLGNKGQEDIPWRSLLVLSLPFLMAYLLLLAPRAISTGLFDRYLLPILLVILPARSAILSGIHKYTAAVFNLRFCRFRRDCHGCRHSRSLCDVPCYACCGCGGARFRCFGNCD